MSDNKKYYYLQFKENYFEQDHIKVLESMANGYIYSLIILKLYLKSLKHDGQLRINEYIPYISSDITLLSKVIGHDPDHVSHAINAAKSLGVIEIITTGEMFMKDIQNFIGHGSSDAERKRKYRKMIENAQNLAIDQKVGQIPPELELDIELEKDKYILSEQNQDTCNNKKYDEYLKSEPSDSKVVPPSDSKVGTKDPSTRINQSTKYNIYIVTDNVMRHWNEQPILSKAQPIDSNKQAISSALKKHTEDEIHNAIDNYVMVLKESSFFNYKWSLKDFMKTGVKRFINRDDVRSKYIGAGKKPPKQITDIDEDFKKQQFSKYDGYIGKNNK